MTQAYILTLSCPDRLGLVHAVSGFLLEQGGNIEEAAQYNDTVTGLFFMRVQFACDGKDPAALKASVAELADQYQMQWSLHSKTERMKTVIMVSKEGHCLNDLLFRWKSGLLPIEIKAIVSNHREFYQLAASYNIPFHHIPVTAATKAQAEERQYEIIQEEGAELVVLVAGKLHPHEEQARGVVVVLRGFFDVAAVLQQEARNGVHQPEPVGAGQCQDV